jgi:uncharacterized protein YcbK (DUF882 family)
VQVSRFPIDVEASENNNNIISFADSRFPTNMVHYKKNLAVLEPNRLDDKGRTVYVLRSRLIKNEKYSEQNDDYHSRETADLKKLSKFLRDYVKPYSPLEVSKMGSDVSDDLYRWRGEARRSFSEVVGQVSESDVAEEVAYLKSVGVAFRSDKFRDIAANGLELYDELKRRENEDVKSVHVYINPDESVNVTVADDKTYSYETLEGVPEAVRQQVALLMMVDMKQYVPEVGKRTAEKMFWVHVNTNIFNDSNP